MSEQIKEEYFHETGVINAPIPPRNGKLFLIIN